MMKKLLYAIPFFFFQSAINLFADSLTTGDPILVLPTTGVVDLRQSYGDKVNANFKAISSTLSNVIDAVAVATAASATFPFAQINSTGIQNNAVGGIDMGLKAIVSTGIADQAVEGWNFRGPAVSSHIAPQSVTGLHLRERIILSSHTSGDVGNAVVFSSNIGVGAVTGLNLAVGDGTGIILSSHVVPGQIDHSDIAGQGIAGKNIGLSIILSTHIAPETILGGDIANGEVTFDKRGPGFLTADIVLSSHIATNEIRGRNLSSQLILSTHIAGQAIQGWNFQGPVIGTHTASGFITGLHIGGSVVMSSHIVDGQIATGDLAAGIITGIHFVQGDTIGFILSTHIAQGTIQAIDLAGDVGSHVIFSSNIGNNSIEGWNIRGPILSTHAEFGHEPSSVALFSQDEGTFVGAASSINFTGAGVSASQAGGLLTVTITGGSADVSSTTVFIQDEGSFQGIVSTLNITGAGASISVAGGVATLNVPSGGGGTTYLSTFTTSLAAGGDVFIATTAFVAVPGAFFRVMQDTIVITSAQPFTLHPSTVADTQFSVFRSTEIGGTNIRHQPIHSSSFTVPVNSHYGDIVAPNSIATVFPNEALSLWTTIVPSSGALPAEYGVTLRYFKRP